MCIVFKKIFFAFILTLVVFTTGAWQSDRIVLAESPDQNIPETPLYPDLTWNNLGLSIRDIKINIKGDSISLSGESHEAVEQFAAGLPQDVLNYYSNEQLAKSGWASYDAFDGSDGVHYVFYHESGMYLSVEFLKCRDVPSSTCVTVWKSEQTDPTPAAPADAYEPDLITAAGSFSKTSPANGATNLNPTSIVLSWGAYSPSPDKYTYCVKDGSECTDNWTSTYNTSVTLTDLDYNKTYYWQVRAITCIDCVPKKYVDADAGAVWTFKTKPRDQVVIIGNAGVGGATLSYTDSTLKTVTADSSGNYSITLPLNWSGTVTPTKSGYMFSPTSASFSNLTAAQTIQNFIAAISIVISGNAGTAGTIMSYTDTTAKTATADGSGNYSISVPYGWSGTITPTRTGFPFTPVSRSYSNVQSNQTAQDYTNYWYGSASITANKNVVAVGRPHVGDEVASYSGFSAGALTAYVPMLFKNAFGGTYDSALYIQNVDASVTANVAIKYYDSTTGALTCTDTETIKPLASKGYWLPTLSAAECLPSGLPAGWVGSAVVTSSTTAKIVANGRPHIGAEVMTYDSFSSGSLTSYLPMLFNGAYGGGYNSAFYVQNVSPTVTAAVTIKYYNSDTGALTCSDTATILPNTSTGYWLPTAKCLYGASTTPAGLPAGWIGGVVVTSSAAPIVTVGRPHVGSQITTYTGFAAGGLSSYVPMLFRKAYGGAYDSALYVQNVDSYANAAITIKYYKTNGALTCTATDTIAPLSSKGYWLPNISAAECAGGLPDDWVGGAVVTSSTANIVAIGRPHIGAQVTTYNGFSSGNLNSYLPMLFNKMWGTYDSAFYVQNTDAAEASVTVKFYDVDGNLSCTRSDKIPALSTLGYWVPSVACAP